MIKRGMIHNATEMVDLIQEIGFLPLLYSGISGYSAEDVVDSDCRYVVYDDGGWDWPMWKWKGPLLDYSNLLALTGYLTHNEADVEQMFRRMVFNYLTDNKDDHCKNFSFIITQDAAKQYSWHLAPAYDLTWCAEGYNGEHATSVNGTGNPTLEDMVSVGVHINMPEQRCQDLYQEVKSACAAGGLLHHEIKE